MNENPYASPRERGAGVPFPWAAWNATIGGALGTMVGAALLGRGLRLFIDSNIAFLLGLVGGAIFTAMGIKMIRDAARLWREWEKSKYA